MELLRILTLVYAGVLVVALATSLVAILVWLRRIAQVLDETQEALARVDEGTRPLAELLQPFDELPSALASAFAETDDALVRANARLTDHAERLGVLTRQP